MFPKISRYRKLPDVVAVDAKGRTLVSKSLRLLPEVSGTFLHTVEEVDRLDHLAYKYYDQPRKWWRICDANPEFMSPQALLGKEPVVTARFPLTFTGAGQLPWADLLRQLAQPLGVEDVRLVQDIQLIIQQENIGVEQYTWTVIVTYNLMNVSAGALAGIISAAGFDVTQPEPVGRVGKKIIIPPNVIV